MRAVVKIGGAQLGEAQARARLAQAVASAQERGHEVILVHGGGDQIRALTPRLGLTDRYHEGLRITDAATAEVALMVLGGQVNRWLVHALQGAGIDAVGITGADGDSFRARPLQNAGVDLGFVGEVSAVDARLIEALLDTGVVPVIATVAPLDPAIAGDASQFYNINADHAAGPLARAFAAEALLFLTDVPGVLDGDGTLIPRLTPSRCHELRQAGVIRGGMIPKVEAAFAALAAHPRATVKIAPAAVDGAIDNALLSTTGTTFVCDR
ncbi:MAG: acetylglutamate kinase [Planctomycetes bacterium]|nr:acetylglutamate kinase [Planctomycetota bacterium]MCB9870872.1 acetylglutamate kinase [Planctomycetota bacterium]